MMDHPVVSGLMGLALFAVIGYFAKLDLADMTGLAKKSAKKNMQPLANELGYELIAPRTPDQQGGLAKKASGYRIRVDADKSRIQIEFNKNLRMRLSSLTKNDFDNAGLKHLEFSEGALNGFFPLRAAAEKMQARSADLETALIPLVDRFDSRKVAFLYVKDEYLRVGFNYRNYLPTDYLKELLPVLEQAAKQLVALK